MGKRVRKFAVDEKDYLVEVQDKDESIEEVDDKIEFDELNRKLKKGMKW